MLLKRIYAKPAGWQKAVDDKGECTNPPPVVGAVLVHSGTSPEQKFTPKLLLDAAMQGWARFEDGKVILDVQPEPLVYTVRRGPGCYCCHCGASLRPGAAATAHVADAHAGVASPDANNPSGYEISHAYDCVLDAGQHVRYRAWPGKVHRPLSAPARDQVGG